MPRRSRTPAHSSTRFLGSPAESARAELAPLVASLSELRPEAPSQHLATGATWHLSSLQPADGASPKYASSASFSIRERIRNRIPVGPSTLNPAPRPGTTSTVRCVYFQY